MEGLRAVSNVTPLEKVGQGNYHIGHVGQYDFLSNLSLVLSEPITGSYAFYFPAAVFLSSSILLKPHLVHLSGKSDGLP